MTAITEQIVIDIDREQVLRDIGYEDTERVPARMLALLDDYLARAGLVDAATFGAGATNNTFHSTAPFQRIDYIWVSLDLTVTEASTPLTTASDRLPVIAVMDL